MYATPTSPHLTMGSFVCEINVPMFQGDSGGPLYFFEKTVKKAVLVGVVNRGKGCARKNALGIYARVRHYLPWIKEVASSGKC